MTVTSAFKIWTADADGEFVTKEEPDTKRKVPDPASSKSVDIYMAVTGTPSESQAKLFDEMGYALDVVRRIYLTNSPNEAKFRDYFVRLFRLAQVGLEGPDSASKQARSTFEAIKTSILDDEGGRIKTRNFVALGEAALLIGIVLGVLYFVLQISAQSPLERLLETLQFRRVALANFLILLCGCLLGVCLSYGVRTSTMTLSDLVSSGADRLPPTHRLLFIGALTGLFGLLFTSGIVELKVGSLSTAEIASNPGLAFIVGAFFGLGESALPGLAGKRAETFLKGLQ